MFFIAEMDLIQMFIRIVWYESCLLAMFASLLSQNDKCQSIFCKRNNLNADANTKKTQDSTTRHYDTMNINEEETQIITNPKIT